MPRSFVSLEDILYIATFISSPLGADGEALNLVIKAAMVQ